MEDYIPKHIVDSLGFDPEKTKNLILDKDTEEWRKKLKPGPKKGTKRKKRKDNPDAKHYYTKAKAKRQATQLVFRIPEEMKKRLNYLSYNLSVTQNKLIEIAVEELIKQVGKGEEYEVVLKKK